jgi:hypothetical protein
MITIPVLLFTAYRWFQRAVLQLDSYRTNSTELNGFSATQKIFSTSWNAKINSHVHKSPSLVSTLTYANPVRSILFLYDPV